MTMSAANGRLGSCGAREAELLAALAPLPRVVAGAPSARRPAARARGTVMNGTTMSWIERLKAGLENTRKNVQRSLTHAMGRGLAPETLDAVEASLLRADVGVRTADRLMERLRAAGNVDPRESLRELKQAMVDILASAESASIESLIESGPRPFVIVAVGVNGAGENHKSGETGRPVARTRVHPAAGRRRYVSRRRH